MNAKLFDRYLKITYMDKIFMGIKPKFDKIMVHKSKFINILFFILSIYFFFQSTFFAGNIAFLAYYLWPPKSNGIPASFSPYLLIPYFNFALYCGLSISGILFCLSAEPFMTRLFKHRRIISVPLTIIFTPIFFILLYALFTVAQYCFS